ncbi:hypothetical protein H634G_09193 [Metarhizium anisopliae BRIP 53293]|uniref:Uncharacterized protein n=1 Tax=Metarhizium anisopliae BRIP 53293 TaxID=1291518 RepID=A0A0D9NPE7_METAN|nr:hypothetical protein H634G_09193 [Metarhizium anisopliae BRIP 53293]KJK90227.1 hypothetical protein H633G_05903 [Metarhizium anisopliae BRIP 53284]
MPVDPASVPNFNDLPKTEGMPPAALQGMSIGGLWDRCSFMLTSAPLNIPCRLGSPPNTLAVL